MLPNENAHHANRNVPFVMHQNAHIYLSVYNCDASSKTSNCGRNWNVFSLEINPREEFRVDFFSFN